MLSLSSFSQTDTTKTILPNKVLRTIAKDLIKYDGCKEELTLTKNKIEKLQERENQKDTIISLYKDKDENNKYIIHQLELQTNQYDKLSNDLNNELKNQKTKTFLWKLGTFVGIITTSYLLIK
jgi:DNA-directed RNA polymerase specialized sigma subunit